MAGKHFCNVGDCKKSFTSKPSLNEHLRSHTGEKLSCGQDGCQYTCAGLKTMRLHKAKKHPKEDTSVLFCRWEGCQYNSSRCDNLKRHQSNCGRRPEIWAQVPNQDLPSGIRVTRAQHGTVREQQFGEEPDNLPEQYRPAVQAGVEQAIPAWEFPEAHIPRLVTPRLTPPFDLQAVPEPIIDMGFAAQPANFDPMHVMGFAAQQAAFNPMYAMDNAAQEAAFEPMYAMDNAVQPAFYNPQPGLDFPEAVNYNPGVQDAFFGVQEPLNAPGELWLQRPALPELPALPDATFNEFSADQDEDFTQFFVYP